MSALGGLIWYLRSVSIAKFVIPLKYMQLTIDFLKLSSLAQT